MHPPTIHRPLRPILAAVFAFPLVLGCATDPAANPAPQPIVQAVEVDDVTAIGRKWLLLNCDTGEEGNLAGRVQQVGLRLEAVFINAFERGPDERLLAEVGDAAAERFQQRRKLLEGGQNGGLSQEDLEAARRVTREQFVEREKADFVLRYRSQALAGLGLTGGDKGRELLERVARDDASPLQTTAREALAQAARR